MDEPLDAPLKPGPVRRLDTRLTSVMLEPDLIEWAKRQPGGLAETLRRLLREAMAAAESESRQALP